MSRKNGSSCFSCLSLVSYIHPCWVEGKVNGKHKNFYGSQNVYLMLGSDQGSPFSFTVIRSMFSQTFEVLMPNGWMVTSEMILRKNASLQRIQYLRDRMIRESIHLNRNFHYKIRNNSQTVFVCPP